MGSYLDTSGIRQALFNPTVSQHITPALYHLGCAKIECGDYKGAIEKLKGAINLDPNNPGRLTFLENI